MKNAMAGDYKRQALAHHWTKAVLTWVLPLVITMVGYYLVMLVVIMAAIALMTELNSTKSVMISMYIGIGTLSFFTNVLVLSYNLLMLHWLDTKQPSDSMAVFSFMWRFGWGILKIVILESVFILAWSFLLYIPGIIKSFSYSQAVYIYYDRLLSRKGPKTVSALECITASRQLMDGHKWKLFELEISFLGWWLLGILSIGIGFLWIIPYVSMTQAVFYRQLIQVKSTKFTTADRLVSEDRFTPNDADFGDFQQPVNDEIGLPYQSNEPLYRGSDQSLRQAHVKKGPRSLFIALTVLSFLLVVEMVNYGTDHFSDLTSSDNSSNKNSSSSKQGAAAPHDGIAPSVGFYDGLDLANQDTIKHNQFEPQTGKVTVDYQTKTEISNLRPMALNAKSQKWLGSKIKVDQAWVAQLKPTTIEVSDQQQSVNGVVILHVSIQTGKYDNDYYPGLGKLVTNLGTCYEAVNSSVFDGGIPHDQTRDEYLYFYLKQPLNNVAQVQNFSYQFNAYAEDEQTEDLDNSNYQFRLKFQV